jgi:hypothetical protein
LFLIPGAIVAIIGLLGVAALSFGPLVLGGVTLDISSEVYFAGLTVVGYQALAFGFLIKLYASHEGFLPPSKQFQGWSEKFTIERGLVLGGIIFLIGLAIAIVQIIVWGQRGFGALNATDTIRLAIPGALALMIGFQTAMASMFAGIFSIARRSIQ